MMRSQEAQDTVREDEQCSFGGERTHREGAIFLKSLFLRSTTRFVYATAFSVQFINKVVMTFMNPKVACKIPAVATSTRRTVVC